MRSMAQRLGVSESSLLAYLDANGGAPDGGDHAGDHGHDLVAELLNQRLASRALPEWAGHRQRRAPWVKRDRPRYFMPG